jgi:hypothetical protein
MNWACRGGAEPIAGKPPLRKFCANFNAVGGKRREDTVHREPEREESGVCLKE